MEPTKEELLAAQLAEWPNSTILTDDELIDGVSAQRGYSYVETVKRYRGAYPNAIAYRVGNSDHIYYGMRYGLEGCEYLSF